MEVKLTMFDRSYGYVHTMERVSIKNRHTGVAIIGYRTSVNKRPDAYRFGVMISPGTSTRQALILLIIRSILMLKRHSGAYSKPGGLNMTVRCLCGI